MDSRVDEYLLSLDKWQEELTQLRKILLDCQLKEEWKWRSPCYSYQGKNIAIIGGFKNYCTLSFFKGALLDDSYKILSKPGKNTQAARIFRITDIREIFEKETIIKAYIFEAVEVEKAGLKVEFKKPSDYPVPVEFQNKLDENPELKAAYESLTPGRQRAYLLYFSDPRHSLTKQARVEKKIPRLLMRKGVNDCICGRSRRMPYCDGSHRENS